ncbi:PLP-dependent aminotransferase family protein [Sphingomonas sp. NPDC019816]|uniref:aminotransferase-like domain-containing protein n=1 Tax=Sphingomonas sp. NPDC019816 TaxID=3390679 RepID=UPI003D012E59
MTSLSHFADQDTFYERDCAIGAGQMARVIDAVERQIEQGMLIAGQRLPSIRAMAGVHSVSRDTVQRAYDRLVASGRIYARRGSGFYVSAPPAAPPPSAPAAVPPDDRVAFQLIYASPPLDCAPGSGVLRHEASAIDELNRVVKSVAAFGMRANGYGELAGYRPLREHLRQKFAIEGIDVPVDSIFTVPGCIAGIGIVVRAFVRPGRPVLIENPSSYMHLNALLSQGASIFYVPRLADGPDMHVLRELCERHRPVMFLLSSLIQNPTGSCISLHKARQLIEIAAEFDMILVDDAAYADLLPPGNGRLSAPLMLLDHLDRVIHVGGTSRILTPDVGIGYIVAGDRYVDMLRRFRSSHLLGNLLLAERVFYRFLDEGLYRRRCERVRANLAQSMVALQQHVTRLRLDVAPAVGGMFLWVDCGEGADTRGLSRQMLNRGFLMAPGRHFCPPGVPSSKMRFNVTTSSTSALQAFAEVLSSASS